MQAIDTAGTVDFATRLRRSQGRSGRKCVASAKLTEGERGELDAAARADGKALSEWAREVMLREARSRRTDALFTEIVATRMLLNLVLKSVACGEVMTPESFSAVLTKVRTTKHKQAFDMMEQYATPDQKES
jgi:hypothetical protein